MSSSIYVVVGNVNMSPTLRKIKHYNPMQEKVPSIYQATGASQLIENFSEGVLQCDFYVCLFDQSNCNFDISQNSMLFQIHHLACKSFKPEPI
jgi:hypothetical protein